MSDIFQSCHGRPSAGGAQTFASVVLSCFSPASSIEDLKIFCSLTPHECEAIAAASKAITEWLQHRESLTKDGSSDSHDSPSSISITLSHMSAGSQMNRAQAENQGNNPPEMAMEVLIELFKTELYEHWKNGVACFRKLPKRERESIRDEYSDSLQTAYANCDGETSPFNKATQRLIDASGGIIDIVSLIFPMDTDETSESHSARARYTPLSQASMEKRKARGGGPLSDEEKLGVAIGLPVSLTLTVLVLVYMARRCLFPRVFPPPAPAVEDPESANTTTLEIELPTLSGISHG
ncbi:hypothetical protein QFC22_006110 [Naganishia vaughanmartiniae]|uniref:Uncharacterized protein n=1 Tax=Naganishia vaughanmartiniae TaxID=1424756 RepID=A0ACC2WP97_9TREE|nr:hypothetical protein QFC22_006110 [Naganishia vaughanmartiniae]